LAHWIDFLAFVVLVVRDLRHDFIEDVELRVEFDELAREDRVGTEAAVLEVEAVDLERIELVLEVDRVLTLDTERVEDVARVLEDTDADDWDCEIFSLNREAFSCR
jgi:hypothetical protein